MEKLPYISDETSTGAAVWVAPRQTVESFSIAELTRFDIQPGDDGAGIFTANS